MAWPEAMSQAKPCHAKMTAPWWLWPSMVLIENYSNIIVFFFVVLHGLASLFMEIQYLLLFSAIFHSHLPISSTHTVHVPKMSSISLLDAPSPVNVELTSQTKCSISSINDGDVKNGVVDQPVPCTCFCSMIMISFLVLFIAKRKHATLHATMTATTLQVVDVDMMDSEENICANGMICQIMKVHINSNAFWSCFMWEEKCNPWKSTSHWCV